MSPQENGMTQDTQDDGGFFDWLKRQPDAVKTLSRGDQITVYCETDGGGGGTIDEALDYLRSQKDDQHRENEVKKFNPKDAAAKLAFGQTI